MAQFDYSKTPSFKDLGDPGYMGPKDGRRDWSQPDPRDHAPAPAPVSMPNAAPSSMVNSVPYAPQLSGPTSFAVSARAMATLGAIGAALWALFAVHGSWALVAAWSFGGAVAGFAFASALWLLGKLLEFSLWLVGLALKIAAVAIGLYVAWYVFLR